jgi:hypothetical protein
MTQTINNEHKPLPINPPRHLKPEEKSILGQLLSAEFQGREKLLRQLPSARVSEECHDCQSIKLMVDKAPGNISFVKRRIPIEAEALDSDGVKIHILLHVVHGFMDEIEIFREDLLMVKQLPEPSSLELINLNNDH